MLPPIVPTWRVAGEPTSALPSARPVQPVDDVGVGLELGVVDERAEHELPPSTEIDVELARRRGWRRGRRAAATCPGGRRRRGRSRPRPGARPRPSPRAPRRACVRRCSSRAHLLHVLPHALGRHRQLAQRRADAAWRARSRSRRRWRRWAPRRRPWSRAGRRRWRCVCTHLTVIGGASGIVWSLYSSSAALRWRPSSSYFVPSESAWPMPIITPPSTWPSAPISLMIVPESCEHETSSTRTTPVSRSSLTRTAWQLTCGADQRVHAELADAVLAVGLGAGRRRARAVPSSSSPPWRRSRRARRSTRGCPASP